LNIRLKFSPRRPAALATIVVIPLREEKKRRGQAANETVSRWRVGSNIHLRHNGVDDATVGIFSNNSAADLTVVQVKDDFHEAGRGSWGSRHRGRLRNNSVDWGDPSVDQSEVEVEASLVKRRLGTASPFETLFLDGSGVVGGLSSSVTTSSAKRARGVHLRLVRGVVDRGRGSVATDGARRARDVHLRLARGVVRGRHDRLSAVLVHEVRKVIVQTNLTKAVNYTWKRKWFDSEAQEKMTLELWGENNAKLMIKITRRSEARHSRNAGRSWITANNLLISGNLGGRGCSCWWRGSSLVARLTIEWLRR
jgi:hypothetical protein